MVNAIVAKKRVGHITLPHIILGKKKKGAPLELPLLFGSILYCTSIRLKPQNGCNAAGILIPSAT